MNVRVWGGQVKPEQHRQSPRWWESIARSAGLELPATVAHVPSWLLVDGETRRMMVGPDVRKVGVGSAWTARVIVTELEAMSPLPPTLLKQVLDPAMEGPLWLDLWPTGISLEGAMVAREEDLGVWIDSLSRVLSSFTPHSHDLSGSRLRALLPDCAPGGIVVWLGGVAHLTALVQVPPLVSADFQTFGRTLRHLAIACGLSEDEGNDLGVWYQKVASDAKWFQLAFPVGRRGLTLRAWNVPSSLALELAAESGSDDEAISRTRSLLELAQHREFAWLELSLRPSEPSRLRLALDLGLLEY